MAAHLSGVAKRIVDEAPRAMFVLCMAHCLNLCLQECASICYCGREALALTSELASLIRAIFHTVHERMPQFVWFRVFLFFKFQIIIIVQCLS